MSEMFTTAAMLLAFQHELIEGGVSHDVVDDIIRDAAHVLVRDGLAVRNV